MKLTVLQYKLYIFPTFCAQIEVTIIFKQLPKLSLSQLLFYHNLMVPSMKKSPGF